MNQILYSTVPEFDKEFKKLCKKYRTLPEDLANLKKSSINLFHMSDFDNGGMFAIPGFCNKYLQSYKVKKFASRSFKTSGAYSGFRLIYIFLPKTGKVIFIEIYHKNEKENEDKVRLKTYFKELAE
ncbi:MAG: hypothetical protein QY314_00025 [Candidatus Dojkabacteria bacterium]|nr:MAG: hypothetical protein QY314_00025 [Candidatus Dojkabacteria bacterium]